MFEPLQAAIADQYAAFTARRPRVVEGCKCCTTPQQLAALVSAPRENLKAPDLEFYAWKAMTTVGGSEELRYVWPRLVELTARGELITDRVVIFGKPQYGRHHAWPAAEQRAILNLAAAIGQWLAAEVMEDYDVDEWICSIGRLVEGLGDVRPFLAPLLSDVPAAWANLKTFVDVNGECVARKGRLSSGFWDSAPEGARAVLDWWKSEPRIGLAMRALEVESSELYGTSF